MSETTSPIKNNTMPIGTDETGLVEFTSKREPGTKSGLQKVGTAIVASLAMFGSLAGCSEEAPKKHSAIVIEFDCPGPNNGIGEVAFTDLDPKSSSAKNLHESKIGAKCEKDGTNVVEFQIKPLDKHKEQGKEQGTKGSNTTLVAEVDCPDGKQITNGTFKKKGFAGVSILNSCEVVGLKPAANSKIPKES